MSIKINAKQDYSMLFSGLNRNSSGLNGINLSDYSSIKNGSYGKLLKSYYNKERQNVSANNTSTKNNKVQTTEKKELTSLQGYATDVRDSASVLMQKGSNSVFKDDNTEKIYDAVSSFVKNYNTLMEKGQDSSSASITRSAKNLANTVKNYESSLQELGITINDKNGLSLDKDTFMNADMNKAKDVFNGRNSLSYLVSMRAVSMGNTAYNESNKASLYNNKANYSVPATGDIFSSFV